jgi:hypothetical protein
MNAKRIIWIACLLAFAAIVVGVGLSRWRAPQSLRASEDIWIPLPPEGMDATQRPVREIIMRNTAWPDRLESLAWRCGGGDQDEPREEYVAHIGDQMLEEGQQAWDVTMIPRGGQMEVRIADGRSIPPPPPPPGRTTLERNDAVVDVHWASLASLREIRDAWASKPLWLAAQKDVQCVDGRPVLFEACVQGKYVARFRNCDGDADAAAARLWHLLKLRFPPPPPTRD